MAKRSKKIEADEPAGNGDTTDTTDTTTVQADLKTIVEDAIKAESTGTNRAAAAIRAVLDYIASADDMGTAVDEVVPLVDDIARQIEHGV